MGPGPVWTGAENLATTGFRSLDRPARSEPYQLRYLGHIIIIIIIVIVIIIITDFANGNSAFVFIRCQP